MPIKVQTLATTKLNQTGHSARARLLLKFPNPQNDLNK
jgi:hypothetical protein